MFLMSPLLPFYFRQNIAVNMTMDMHPSVCEFHLNNPCMCVNTVLCKPDLTKSADSVEHLYMTSEYQFVSNFDLLCMLVGQQVD